MKIPLKRSPLIFWTSFLALNFILFAANYIISDQISGEAFLPQVHNGEHWSHLFFYRNHQDLFRLSAEFSFLSFLGFLIPKGRIRKVYIYVLASVWFLLFCYGIYFWISSKFFGSVPYFSNDFILMRDVGMTFLREASSKATILFLLAFVGLLFLGLFFFRWVVKMALAQEKSASNKWEIGLILGFSIYLISSCLLCISSEKRYIAPERQAVYWSSPHIKKSFKKLARQLDPGQLKEEIVYRSYNGHELKQKPDIYFIAIESYGRVLYENERFKNPYFEAIAAAEQSTENAGWHTATSFSTSPIFGGKSWLGFSTLLSGLKIDNQILYKTLVEENDPINHMVRVMNYHGYQSTRLKTMYNKNDSKKIAENDLNYFFEYDRWIGPDDIKYKGYHYSNFGGIPDQYALNFTIENIPHNVEQPQFLFFITMGSHWPWLPPPPILENWWDLNYVKTSPIGQPYPSSKGLDSYNSYRDCILYQVGFMEDLVLRQGDDNSIFIFVGDHQPLHLADSKKENGHDAPLHIVSRNQAFVESFKAYGFNKGWKVADDTAPAPIKHEGFYSLFMREFLREYSKTPGNLPVYLPNGL